MDALCALLDCALGFFPCYFLFGCNRLRYMARCWHSLVFSGISIPFSVGQGIWSNTMAVSCFEFRRQRDRSDTFALSSSSSGPQDQDTDDTVRLLRCLLHTQVRPFREIATLLLAKRVPGHTASLPCIEYTLNSVVHSTHTALWALASDEVT